MKTIRIFISSPGDVANERQICGKIIERLQGRYWSLIRIEDVFWENEALRATGTFQDEIDDPAECEIVIGIIWTKMGSPLPERFTRLDGRTHAPGTEWEIGRAIATYEQKVSNGGDPKTSTPHVVVYRRRDKRAQLADPAEEAKAEAREEEVKEFFEREFHNDDKYRTFKRASISYSGLEDFEPKLLRQLTRLILKQIPVLKSAFNLPPIEGTPYKGLQSFDFTDSDRFFGRTREIRETQRRLIASARKSIPFLLIYGGSGYGKSSLMRAGLAPVITRPGGALAEIQGWRRVSFQPAKGCGPLCDRLARALLQTPDAAEAHHIRERNHWPITGLAELKDENTIGGPWDSASLAMHFADDSLRPIAIDTIKDALERINRHLLLEVDQLEEIFTTAGIVESPQQGAQSNPHSKNNSQIAAFFSTLDALAQSGRVWIVATMRSEFFPRVAETPGLFALVGKDRGYILPPPDRQSLREIIRYPALAARLEFERRDKEILLTTRQENGQTIEEYAKHDYLHDQILADAEDSPDALPLLEFLLQQLFDERKELDEGALLTWDSYVRANGLKGAIAKRATDIFSGLDKEAKEARHRIFAALVHIDPTKGTITRKRAPLDSLKTDKHAEEFLNAFLEAHLLITDEESTTKEPVVTLAHEALISHWDELSTWIKDHRSDLLARQRLAEQTKLWLENCKNKSYLLSEARLAEAERVASSQLFSANQLESELLRHSKQRANRRQRLLQGALLLFAVLAVTASVMSWVASQRRKEADSQRLASQNSLYRSLLTVASQSLQNGELQRSLPYLAKAHETLPRRGLIPAFVDRFVGDMTIPVPWESLPDSAADKTAAHVSYLEPRDGKVFLIKDGHEHGHLNIAGEVRAESLNEHFSILYTTDPNAGGETIRFVSHEPLAIMPFLSKASLRTKGSASLTLSPRGKFAALEIDTEVVVFSTADLSLASRIPTETDDPPYVGFLEVGEATWFTVDRIDHDQSTDNEYLFKLDAFDCKSRKQVIRGLAHPGTLDCADARPWLGRILIPGNRETQRANYGLLFVFDPAVGKLTELTGGYAPLGQWVISPHGHIACILRNALHVVSPSSIDGWIADTSSEKEALITGEGIPFDFEVSSMAISPDGASVAVVAGKTVRIFDMETSAEISLPLQLPASADQDTLVTFSGGSNVIHCAGWKWYLMEPGVVQREPAAPVWYDDKPVVDDYSFGGRNWSIQERQDGSAVLLDNEGTSLINLSKDGSRYDAKKIIYFPAQRTVVLKREYAGEFREVIDLVILGTGNSVNLRTGSFSNSKIYPATELGAIAIAIKGEDSVHIHDASTGALLLEQAGVSVVVPDVDGASLHLCMTSGEIRKVVRSGSRLELQPAVVTVKSAGVVGAMVLPSAGRIALVRDLTEEALGGIHEYRPSPKFEINIHTFGTERGEATSLYRNDYVRRVEWDREHEAVLVTLDGTVDWHFTQYDLTFKMPVRKTSGNFFASLPAGSFLPVVAAITGLEIGQSGGMVEMDVNQRARIARENFSAPIPQMKPPRSTKNAAINPDTQPDGVVADPSAMEPEETTPQKVEQDDREGEGEGKLRSVRITEDISFAEFAKNHNTTIEELNKLNGINLGEDTIIAEGSELYIPLPPKKK